jgi:hypothetical protein
MIPPRSRSRIRRPRRGFLAAAGAVIAVTAAVVASTVSPASGAQEDAAARTIEVDNGAELQAALDTAQPGDTIEMIPGGDYDGAFVATAKGTAEQPITLTGNRESPLTNSGGGYGLHFLHASHWHLFGFEVSNARKGIVLDDSDHITIEAVEVSHVDEEGVVFRSSSTDNVLLSSSVHHTGRERPGHGEAVAIGSPESEWPLYGENNGTGPDRSDRNQVLMNSFRPEITAEIVDIREGTSNAEVGGNSSNADHISGENGADSWMEIKGNNNLISGNATSYPGGGPLVDGFQVHSVVEGYGCGNVFRGNDSELGGAPGYAIHVTNQPACEAASAPNVVYRSNIQSHAGSGLTNIEITFE